MSCSLLMVVPTYNEVDNVAPLLERLHRSVGQAHVLVVDDSSPDGTGALADRLAEHDERVHVLHRSRKEGLGQAYLAGFAWALERDYEVVGEIDADGSHRPEDLPRLVAALEGADLVIGSRWVEGGSVMNWSWRRELLSRLGNAYTRTLLGVAVRDVTAGYRLFRRSTLERVDLSSVQSTGYVFQADLTLRTLNAGLAVTEVPIEFVDRVRGESKMTPRVALESLQRITVWGMRDRLRGGVRRRRAPGRTAAGATRPDG